MPERMGALDASGLKVGVAVADFNEAVTSGLLDGALQALTEAGAAQPTVIHVPGSFELPVAAKHLADSGHDCVVALGAVIRGETDHYEHVATQSITGLQMVAVTTGVPVGLGVLTAQEVEPALERARPGPGNKGAEAAEAAVATCNALRELSKGA